MGNAQDRVETFPTASASSSTKGQRHRQKQHESRQKRQRFVQIGNIALSVIKGDIIQQTTDVLVNSAVPDLDLNKGRASKALVDAAGKSIQSECTNKYPSGINSKTVAITGPGNLHCKAIFHVTLPRWQAQGDEKNIDLIVRNCLVEANKQKLTSMSFPALGTGFLKYPPRTVIASMFKTIEDFAKKTPNTTVKVVNCIVYSEDDETYKADVIVNSCPSDMRLDTRPGLAKVMYDAAGSGLKTEIDENISQRYTNWGPSCDWRSFTTL
ncbi:unnamed protein product [Mytilus coruscus]|uniref:Macro domain-containing protein n=1 Tax=Mytilus coruscus TaxID=42192 RepID=A0A6J8AJ44_MYTCO|nr:unnamed protein product [Mytilus coruscus]